MPPMNVLEHRSSLQNTVKADLRLVGQLRLSHAAATATGELPASRETLPSLYSSSHGYSFLLVPASPLSS